MNYGTRMAADSTETLSGELTFKTGKKVKLTPEECQEFEQWVKIRQETQLNFNT